MIERRVSFGLLLSLIVLLSLPSQAAREDEYRQWLQQQNAALQAFKDERDRAFADYLKKQWREMELFAGIKRDPKPKPVSIPVAPAQQPPPPSPLKELPKQLPPAPTISAPEKRPAVETPEALAPPAERLITPKSAPATPTIKSPRPPVITPAPLPSVKAPPKAVSPTLSAPQKRVPQASAPQLPLPPAPPRVAGSYQKGVNFYGIAMSIPIGPKVAKIRLRRVNKEGIGEFWEEMSRTDYEATVIQLKLLREAYRLNGWMFAELTDRLGQAIYKRQPNERRLFSWYMLAKAGYRARVGFGEGRILLLLPTRHQLFEVPFFTLSGNRYYVASFDGDKRRPKRLFTYDGSYPGANRAIEVDLSVAPLIVRQDRSKVFKFNYQGGSFRVPVTYDANTVAMLQSYPQTELGIYFGAAVNQGTSQTLLDALRPHLKGRTEEDAVNFLLRFVQTAFEYKTDGGQFGEENYLFPEETLFYPYSDCEDRSFIFAWLVRELLDLQVVGLTFPGHVATAVKFRGPVKGEKFTYHGQTFVLADPTYINATVGMRMPTLRGKRAQVVPIAIL